MWLFVLLIYEISLLLVFSVFFFTWCVKLTVCVFLTPLHFHVFDFLWIFNFLLNIPFSSLSMASI